MFQSKRVRALALTFGVALLATGGAAQLQPLDSGGVMRAVEKLQPGHYIWVPEIAPQGPMLVVVNIATQRLVAYRNGVPIGVSTVSTGKPGHRTPLGVFTVLQKRVHHRSSKYANAPMPYMQRLTWSGIALHGGKLPGYPASHGCIRLPHDFAPLLFGETNLGMTVIVVNQPAQLRLGPTPATVNASYRRGPQAPTVWRPELSPTGPVSIVVSGADRRMIVMRNGVEIGSAPVQFDGEVDRVQAYVMQGVVGGEYKWRKVQLPGQAAAAADVPGTDGGGRFQGSDPFREALATVVGPGTTLVIIPDSLGAFSAPREQLAVLEPEPNVPGWLGDTRVTSGR